jgi:hypothetical protein
VGKIELQMKNKLSNSALNTYNTCGRKYRLHYLEKLRSKYISGALIMGSAMDKGLNELLTSRDLKKATEVFNNEFEYNWINNKKVYVPDSELIVYAKKDFDAELLEFEDQELFGREYLRLTKEEKCLGIEKTYKNLLETKESIGFENMPDEAKSLYNLANWLCLKRKGHLMLQAYHDKVLPKIKKVIAVQKEFNLEGKSGDVLNGFIDLIVEWEDGKKYVLDNKTSTMEYEPDSASKSQQLILYYYVSNKELPPEEKLDGAGFIVLYKQIQKNRIKICESCGHDGTGGRHKTCDKEWTTGRCNGAWKETIKPEARVDIILNEIAPQAQNLVLQTFLGANDGIKKGHFGPNLDSCNKFGQPCQFYNKCWKGEDKDLIQLEAKDEKK